MEYIYGIVGLVVGAIIAYALASHFKKVADRNKINSAEEISRRMIEEANLIAETKKERSFIRSKR